MRFFKLLDCFTVVRNDVLFFYLRHCEERSNPEKNNKNYIKLTILKIECF